MTVHRGYRRVPVVLQTSARDCGPASLTMLLQAHGVRVGLREVRELVDPGRDGVSALGLRDAARELGLDLRALRVDRSSLPAALENLLPCMAHLQGQHFVVIDHVRHTPRGVQIGFVDPMVGRRRLPLAQFADQASGVVLAAAPNRAGESGGGRRASGPPTRRGSGLLSAGVLGPVLRGSWPTLVAILASSAVIAVLGLATPLATARVVDALTTGGDPARILLAGVMTLAAVSGLAGLVRAAAMVAAQRDLGDRLAVRTVETLMRSEHRFVRIRAAGDLLARVVSADVIRDTLTGPLIQLIVDGVVVLMYLTLVTMLAPGLGLVAIALAAVQLAAAALSSQRTRLLRREEVIAEGLGVTRLAEAIDGFDTLRATGVEQLMVGRWAEAYRGQLSAATARLQAVGRTDSVLTAVRVSSPVLLLMTAVRAPESTPGTAIGLAVLAASALMPLSSMANSVRTLQEMGPLLDRVADLIDAPPEQLNQGRDVGTFQGAVRTRNLGFRYDRRSSDVLTGVDLDIRPGTKVGIVGRSGSGKSTLAHVLATVHPPTSGSLELDGHDTANLDLVSVRRHIGVVLQTPFLVAGTVRDNIAWAHDDVRDDEVVAAARCACVADEIEAMPLGYDTQVGDGGLGLSGGQRQRIALARAILRAPAVLVLDEATSALDPATERAVEANLRRLRMTRIVVSHRVSAVADADWVIVLDQGRVVEQGVPSELLASPGHFNRLADADRRGAAGRSEGLLAGGR